jgi:hypothetical protein
MDLRWHGDDTNRIRALANDIILAQSTLATVALQRKTRKGLQQPQLKRLDEALASYDKAIALKPDYAEADARAVEDAIVLFATLLACKPWPAEFSVTLGMPHGNKICARDRRCICLALSSTGHTSGSSRLD